MKVPLFSPYEKYSIDTEGNVYGIRGEIMIPYQRKDGYYQIQLWDGKKHHPKPIHRLIAQIFLRNFDEKLFVDHIDRNPLNNCVQNLRMCTHHQNSMNKTKTSKNTSGYKSISWNKEKKKWHARIKCNGKNIHIGYFENIERARESYNQKASELFGEFAYLEPPREKLKIKFINQSSFSSSE